MRPKTDLHTVENSEVSVIRRGVLVKGDESFVSLSTVPHKDAHAPIFQFKTTHHGILAPLRKRGTDNSRWTGRSRLANFNTCGAEGCSANAHAVRPNTDRIGPGKSVVAVQHLLTETDTQLARALYHGARQDPENLLAPLPQNVHVGRRRREGTLCSIR